MTWRPKVTAHQVRAGFVAASIASSAVVSAVSLTRIAGEQLGFPDGLEWTLTAAADIGAIGGAITWIVSPAGSQARRTGVVSNVACTSVSALFVGLDHAAHSAGGWWMLGAFAVGVFLPLLSTWLVHDLVQSTAAPSTPQRTVVEPPKAKPAPKQKKAAPVTPKRPTEVPSPAQAWARENWPCDAPALIAATSCSRPTAYRVIGKIREEKAREHAA